MKSHKLSVFLAAVCSLFVVAASAGDPKKEVTVHGDGMCGKCALKETDSCQNVIRMTKDDGSQVNLYLAANDISKAFHKHLCKGTAKVVATGKIEKGEDGRKTMTVSSIELDS